MIPERWLEAFGSWLMKRGSWARIMRAPYLRGSHKPNEAGDQPYLDRFFLFRLQGVCGVFLHRFWASDEADLHDHPWDNLSLILRGELVEHYHDGTHQHLRPGAMRVRCARELHRLELMGTSAWTLFIYGPRYRDWGFQRPEGWQRVPYQPAKSGLRGWLFPVRAKHSRDYD